MTDDIRLEGDPVLRQTAKVVPDDLFGTAELADMVSRMTASLRAASNGVAIAAPQIGIPYRIFVVRGFVLAGHERNDADTDSAFINPVLVKHARKKTPIKGEGCLSVPHVYGTVARYEKVTVEAHDVQGKKFKRGGGDLLAEIFQHELDHLEGILFTDKATDLEKIEPEQDTAHGAG